MLPETREMNYFDRHPVRVVSTLNALGLMLWSTVKYPGKDDVVNVKLREPAHQEETPEGGAPEGGASEREES